MWLLSALPGLLWTPLALCSRLATTCTKTSAACMGGNLIDSVTASSHKTLKRSWPWSAMTPCMPSLHEQYWSITQTCPSAWKSQPKQAMLVPHTERCNHTHPLPFNWQSGGVPFSWLPVLCFSSSAASASSKAKSVISFPVHSEVPVVTCADKEMRGPFPRSAAAMCADLCTTRRACFLSSALSTPAQRPARQTSFGRQGAKGEMGTRDLLVDTTAD